MCSLGLLPGTAGKDKIANRWINHFGQRSFVCEEVNYLLEAESERWVLAAGVVGRMVQAGRLVAWNWSFTLRLQF